MVSKDKKHILSLIPGISLNKNDSHCFIQVIYNFNDESKHNSIYTDYLKFDKEQFLFNKQQSLLEIDKNLFSLDNIELDLSKSKTTLNGKIKLFDLTPINTSIINPSIMGIFSYIPYMECYHSIVSMNHLLDGELNLNYSKIDFTGGLGYIEKDYGKSFPINYIWLQSNHFNEINTSLMLSIATIPFLGLKFKGLIALLRYNNEEYRFATYNFSKIKSIKIEGKQFNVVLEKRKYRLIIDAFNEETKDLPSPKDGVMNQTIKEGLSGKVNISLYYKDKLIYQDTGDSAGIEIMM